MTDHTNETNMDEDIPTDEEITVEVTFRKTLRENESPERFVEACLSGGRSNSFARHIDVDVIDREEL